MVSGILVGLFAVFCLDEDSDSGKEYLVLEDSEWNNEIDFEDASSETQDLSKISENDSSQDNRTFVNDDVAVTPLIGKR